VLPNGCFFRGGAELAVRRELVDADLIEAIVQLPVDLFYGAMIPACILVCNRAKVAERERRVLLIDNSRGFVRRDTKNVLAEDAIDRVATSYTRGVEEEGFARFASRDEIVAQHYNLTVRRYVGGSGEANGELLDVDEALAAYREARSARVAAEQRLDAVLEALEEGGE
jgi:type I restriction enzyme M protein